MRLPDDLREPLRAWAVNVALECTHPDGATRLAIGGDVLDLRDLERLLGWVVDAHLPEPAPQQHNTSMRREG